MESGATGSAHSRTLASDRWVARRVQPVVICYLVAVFAAFIAASHFVFHSPEAVKALLVAAVGAIAATVPGVIQMVEYRLTESGIEKRTVNAKKPGQFMNVFEWDQLDRIVPMKCGFKYLKAMNETSPLRRFWNTHISDRFSGVLHVEKQDVERIRGMFEQRGLGDHRRTMNG